MRLIARRFRPSRNRRFHIVIKTDDALGLGSLRELPLDAALALKGGLARELALRAITLSAAEVPGGGGSDWQLGAGQGRGHRIFDGDPFHYRTRVERVLIDGETVFQRQSRE